LSLFAHPRAVAPTGKQTQTVVAGGAKEWMKKETNLEMALDMGYGKLLDAHELENELRRSLCNLDHQKGN
jgi:hypothetical protein